MEKYAVLSKASYDFYHEDKEILEDELKHYGFNHFRLNEELSDRHVGVVLESPDEVVISYRGTDPKNTSDLFADLSILAGRHRHMGNSVIEDRFVQADELYQKVKQSTTKPIILTGHSLGSTIALYTGRKNDEKSVGFNPGASYNDLVIGLMCKNLGKCDDSAKNHTIYTTGKDILSIGNIYGNENIITVTPKTRKDYLYHSLEYFMPERLVEDIRPSYFAPFEKPKHAKKYLDLDTIESFRELQRNVYLHV
jgi:hypothetical protein